jgi:hypothetical protein
VTPPAIAAQALDLPTCTGIEPWGASTRSCRALALVGESLSAGPAGLGTLAIPVVWVMDAWLQLGEEPTGVEAIGMALIIAGLAVLAAQGMAAGHGLESGGEEPAAPPVTD